MLHYCSSQPEFRDSSLGILTHGNMHPTSPLAILHAKHSHTFRQPGMRLRDGINRTLTHLTRFCSERDRLSQIESD